MNIPGFTAEASLKSHNRAYVVKRHSNDTKQRQRLLSIVKPAYRQVSINYPLRGGPVVEYPPSGGSVVDLTPRECNALGGTILYWDSCGGTGLKCRGSNGAEICITELDKVPK